MTVQANDRAAEAKRTPVGDHEGFALARGFIVTARADGSISLNARIVANVLGEDYGNAALAELLRRANSQPDLLAACKRLERAAAYVGGDNPELDDAATDARAAIARAEGGAA